MNEPVLAWWRRGPREGTAVVQPTAGQPQVTQTEVFSQLLQTVIDPSNVRYFRVSLLLFPQLWPMLESFETTRRLTLYLDFYAAVLHP